VEKFTVNVDSFQTEDEHPFVYDHYKITFLFDGNELEKRQDKIVKAVILSQERYCGVSAMLSKSAPITYEIRVNGQTIEQ
ncbi:MAG: OsmC family peroxiredoxin, partial [Massilibacteroides sp.]|nr:OsmC family peroxiredoxin [Massilibacteroides sp.]